MKKFTLEIKWAVIFSLMTILWLTFEKLMGWHDELIAQHASYTNYYAIPSILVYYFALREKRSQLGGSITWLQGFVAGLYISLFVAALSPLAIYISLGYISPDYLTNAIAYGIAENKGSAEELNAYFNLKSYIIQGVIGSMFMGALTAAVIAFVVKKK